MQNSYQAIRRRSGPYPGGALVELSGFRGVFFSQNDKRHWAKECGVRISASIKALAVTKDENDHYTAYVCDDLDENVFHELETFWVHDPRNQTNDYVIYHFLFHQKVVQNRRQNLHSYGLSLWSFNTKIARWMGTMPSQSMRATIRSSRLEVLNISGMSPTTDNHVTQLVQKLVLLADIDWEIIEPVQVKATVPVVLGHENQHEQPFDYKFPDEV